MTSDADKKKSAGDFYEDIENLKKLCDFLRTKHGPPVREATLMDKRVHYIKGRSADMTNLQDTRSTTNRVTLAAQCASSRHIAYDRFLTFVSQLIVPFSVIINRRKIGDILIRAKKGYEVAQETPTIRKPTRSCRGL